MRARLVLALAPLLVATGWLARGKWQSSSPQSCDPPAASAVTISRDASAQLRECVTLQQMRFLLAEAAHSAVPAKTSAPELPERSSEQPPAEVTRESPQAAEVLTSIAQAQSDGRWTAEDRLLLRHGLSILNREQARQVLSRLAVAVNEGRLKPDAPLF